MSRTKSVRPKSTELTAVPTGPNREAPLPGLAPSITSSSDFFTRSHFPVPRLRSESWSLTFDGEVDRPRTWSYRELSGRPQTSVTATLECSGNSRRRFGRPVPDEIIWGDGAVSTATWSGVRLSTLVEEVGLRASVQELMFEGADGLSVPGEAQRKTFGRSLPRQTVDRTEDILVALRMNGEPLPADHGFPARLLVPGWFAMASVKWLTHITAVSQPFVGHYQRDRYVYEFGEGTRATTEPVRTMLTKSIFTYPGDGETLTGTGPFLLTGQAWSGAAPIARVDVHVGEGWREAERGPDLGPRAWLGWRYLWTPPAPGRWTLRVRATDRAGNVQPSEARSNRRQYGHNAIQSVTVLVR